MLAYMVGCTDGKCWHTRVAVSMAKDTNEVEAAVNVFKYMVITFILDAEKNSCKKNCCVANFKVAFWALVMYIKVNHTFRRIFNEFRVQPIW